MPVEPTTDPTRHAVALRPAPGATATVAVPPGPGEPAIEPPAQAPLNAAERALLATAELGSIFKESSRLFQAAR